MANICVLVFMLPLVLSCCIPAQWEGNLGIKFGVMDYGQLSPGWVYINLHFEQNTLYRTTILNIVFHTYMSSNFYATE